MANGHGGARPGAGRKTKTEKYASHIDKAERLIVNRLKELVENELKLGLDGGERVEERYELAATIVVEDHKRNPSGTFVKVKKQLYPDAPEDKLVLVERKVITTEPDRAAIEYCIDRILGKPTASVEAEVSVDAGGALLEAFGGALTKIYGVIPDGADTGGDPGPAAGG